MTNPKDEFTTSSPEVLEAVLHRPNRPINVIAGTIGHFVEWYDWYIYGLLAVVFAGQIFPSSSPFASLHGSAADLRHRVHRPPLQRNHRLPPGRPLRSTAHPDSVRFRDGSRIADHRPDPRIRHDRLPGADPVRHRPHHAGHLGRQRTAKRHHVHGRTRPPEPPRPVRFLHQHGQRPGDPGRDRVRRDRHHRVRRGNPGQLGLAHPVPRRRHPRPGRSVPAGQRR